MKPTDGQLIAIMSHTIGSIGQIIKNEKYTNDEAVEEIKRIYRGYISQISLKWKE